MFLDLAKNTAKFTIFISLIAFTIAWAFGLQSTFLTTQVINGETIIKLEIEKYLTNITNAWTSNPIEFNGIFPTRTWDNSGNIVNWDPYFNNLALVFDYMYMPINAFLTLFRWFAWIQKLGLALIGWDFSGSYSLVGDVNIIYNSILLRFLDWVIQNLFIPYV